jgi:transcriptional regulator with PAS, ATPase and Fis domain
VLQSCIIQNPKQENCEQIEITVQEIYEGGIKDIVFLDLDGKFFYINRGLEQGLTLQRMKNKVLNKKVTLHIAKIITGRSSNHIAQLSLGQEVIYTEFN